MSPAEVTASIQAETAALEQIASLIYEIHARIALLNTAELSQREIDLRIGLIRDLWVQLDELGVDLNLPDLKTLVAAHVATHQTSSGVDAAPSTPAGGTARVGTPANPLPAPLEPDPDQAQ